MLGGLAPILLFQLYKNVTETEVTEAAVPLTSKIRQRVTTAVIPIYLAPQLTGLVLKTSNKNIDIQTDTESTTAGDDPVVNQKALGSITAVTLEGKQSSIGLSILLALSDQILGKVTSQEYEVTFMHGNVVVFGGLLHSFSYDNSDNDDLVRMKIEFARGRPRTKQVQVAEDPEAIRLGTTGITPDPAAPTKAVVPNSASSGQSVITPRGLH